MIAIINYNAGNTRSVENSLKRLGYNCTITDNIDEIKSASKVILPGVGEAKSAMQCLEQKRLKDVIKALTQPVLGICLGLQLMCKFSEEGNTNCLGIFDTQVKKFPPIEPVPQMGWNNLTELKGELFNGVEYSDNFYFVHSYYAEICENTVGICDYILPFSAALKNRNFYATQFHPEKSGSIGEKILKNFLKL